MRIRSSKINVGHVVKSSSRPFDEVIAEFENQLGRVDLNAVKDSVAKGGPYTAIKEMEGSSGLMIFGAIDLGAVIPSLYQTRRKAIQYLVGNPFILDSMIRHHIEVGLYAPLRILVAETDAGTTFMFDKPTTLFGQWNDARISAVAQSLEERLEKLTDKALGQKI